MPIVDWPKIVRGIGESVKVCARVEVEEVDVSNLVIGWWNLPCSDIQYSKFKYYLGSFPWLLSVDGILKTNSRLGVEL